MKKPYIQVFTVALTNISIDGWCLVMSIVALKAVRRHYVADLNL